MGAYRFCDVATACHGFSRLTVGQKRGRRCGAGSSKEEVEGVVVVCNGGRLYGPLASAVDRPMGRGGTVERKPAPRSSGTTNNKQNAAQGTAFHLITTRTLLGIACDYVGHENSGVLILLFQADAARFPVSSRACQPLYSLQPCSPRRGVVRPPLSKHNIFILSALKMAEQCRLDRRLALCHSLRNSLDLLYITLHTVYVAC